MENFDISHPLNQLTNEQKELIEKSINRNLVMPEFKVKNFVGNAQITPYAKLKQYIIELNGREMAVENMLYETKKIQLEIELERERAEKVRDVSPAESKLHELEIFKLHGLLKRSELKLRDAVSERDLFLKIIEDFNNSDEAFLPDGRKLIDVLDDPTVSNELEKQYWTLRLAKQTAMDMVAYGRAGVGNMDAVTMLEPNQQLEVMQLACDFFVKNEIRTNNLLSAVNQQLSSNRLQNTELTKQLNFKPSE